MANVFKAGFKELKKLSQLEGKGDLLKNDGQMPAVVINPREDVVVMPYSSGTSGRPKGVMLTHYNLVAQMCQLDSAWKSTEGESMISPLPFFHIAGIVGSLLLGIWKGIRLVTMPRFDLEQYLQLSEKYEATRAVLVPPIVLGLAKHPIVDKYHLSKLRVIYSAAAPLSENVARACGERLHCMMGQAYGMTEVSGASHVTPDEPDMNKPGSVGFCLPQMEVKLMDTISGAEVGQNELGEIWMRGPNVMKGYLNNPQATASTIDADGWLHSGDVGYVDDKGYMYVVDRVKELIKYNAYQVAPAELEAVLLANPAIADAAVIPSPDEEAGEVPKAFIVLRAPLTEQQIMDFVAGRVAPYKKIRRVEIVGSVPLMRHGSKRPINALAGCGS
ncbi:MAG: AMP-binding protein [Chloroflexi bacterium]|nr:AMP-binding protein [Chloroflexota bacterium]